MSTIGKRGWTTRSDRTTAKETGRAERVTDLSWCALAFYFHANAFTRDGDIYVFCARPDYSGGGVDLFALIVDEGRVVQLTESMPGGSNAVVAPGRREVIYTDRHNRLMALHIDTMEERGLCAFPEEDVVYMPTVSCDEQFAATITFPKLTEPGERLDADRVNREWPDNYFSHPRRYSAMWLVPIEGGEPTCLIHTNEDWLGHIQFSPTDPEWIMFCHEGHWQTVERLWMIRRDGTGMKCLLPRKEKEAAGHEFFSADGRRVWFDLMQTDEYFDEPGQYLACIDPIGSEMRGWKIPPGTWSVHYNRTPDPERFVGDGWKDSKAILGYRLTEDGSLAVEKLSPYVGTYSPLNVPPNPEVQTDPAGRYVYYNQQVGEDVQIYRAPLDTA